MEEAQGKSGFGDLPIEITQLILKEASSSSDLVRFIISLVCHDWCNIIHNNMGEANNKRVSILLHCSQGRQQGMAG